MRIDEFYKIYKMDKIIDKKQIELTASYHNPKYIVFETDRILSF